MLASSLLVRPLSEVPEDSGPPGFRELLAEGLVVRLGPGLLGTQGPLAAVQTAIEEQLVAGLSAAGAVAVGLPASEGEALVNLALHGGLVGGRGARLTYALGAGFRHEGPRPRGLFDGHLYRRLDVLASGPVELATLLGGLLERLGLDDLEATTDDELQRWTVDLGGEQPEELGQCRRRALGTDGPRLQLASLDLHAVLGALAERRRDGHGPRWPAGLAPWDLALLAVDGGVDPKLIAGLEAAGLSLLVDDRDGTAGERRRQLLAWGLPALVLIGGGASRGELVLERRADDGPPRRMTLAELLAAVAPAAGSGPPATRRRANY